MDLKSNLAEGVSGTQIDNVEIHQITEWNDTLYLATKLGLYSMDLKGKKVKFISSRSAIPDFNLTSINSHENEIWIGNSYGIAYKNLLTNSWGSFPDLSIKPEIRDIAFTNSAVWFATNKGLMKFNREMNSWRLFTTSDGLINNNVYHIEVENDNLWLSTEKGFTIFRFNRPGRLD
jgi:ligand-binding sensor domain-containing protein